MLIPEFTWYLIHKTKVWEQIPFFLSFKNEPNEVFKASKRHYVHTDDERKSWKISNNLDFREHVTISENKIICFFFFFLPLKCDSWDADASWETSVTAPTHQALVFKGHQAIVSVLRAW